MQMDQSGAAVRSDRVMDVADVVDLVEDGMTIAIGGMINAGHPMLVVREIIRRKRRNLCVVGAASAGLETDLLIAAGCVSKVIAPYISAESLAPIGPAYRAAAERGLIDVFEIDEALYYCGLRAAAQRVPFNPWKAGVGTSLPEINPALKVFQDPIGGETLIAVPAINIGIAFLHAAVSDRYGNVQHQGSGYGDRAIYAASERTFVQVERIVSTEEVRADPLRTSIPGADGVIRAPFGAHPFSSHGYYREDQNHIRKYVAAASNWMKTGDDGDLRAYLDEYIYQPEDHFEYLERVGVRNFLSLQEF